jgi:hypothetical protein
VNFHPENQTFDPICDYSYIHLANNVPHRANRVNSSAEDMLGVLQRYSGDKLTHTGDLAILFEAASQHKMLDTLEELSFHAKFVANARDTLQRVGPSNADAARLSDEMQTELSNVTRLARLLLARASASTQERFAATFFAATPDALQNLLALCYDLSWYKNWLIDHPGDTPVAQSVPQRTARFTVWRVSLCVLLLGALTWFGTFITHIVLANELLEPGTVTVNPALSPDVEIHLYRTLGASAIPMVISYIVVFISGLIFLRTSPFRLRENGWLLMGALLFYLFVPVELFVMSLDIRMALLRFSTGVDVSTMRELFLARLGALAGTPFIAVLCYLTIIPLAIFQPFRRTARQHS